MDRNISVLVVDDERGMREGCRRILEEHVAVVATAESGEEALRRFREAPFDLALVDIRMSGMGGLELLEQLRSLDPDLVTVVVTGYATLQTVIEATKRGAHDVLPKPFSPDELLAKVFSAMERRHLAIETRRLREERERQLLEIATEQSRLRTIINCMQDGVLVTNRDDVVVLYNPAAMRLLGLKGSDLLRCSIGDCTINPELLGLLAQVMDQGESAAMLAREIQGAENGQVLMANVAPVRDEGGERLGAVAVLRDITSLKELDRAKSQFVSMVSHELRAPLAVVEGYLGMVLDGLTGDDPTEEREVLGRARVRAAGMLTLIDDLLDISRIEAGQMAKRIEPLDISQVVREVLALLRPQAEGRSVELRDDLPESLPAVEADREDILRLFTNLVGNAVKYNREGGEVRLSGRVEGEQVRVDVSDTGVGIPADALDKIFDEFYRVKRPETKDVTGTGLGLAIAGGIVKSYNGVLAVASELGVGSTFSVMLPLSRTTLKPPITTEPEH
ncbi:MAG: sensor histidine kinase [Chloroflexota bacterium]